MPNLKKLITISALLLVLFACNDVVKNTSSDDENTINLDFSKVNLTNTNRDDVFIDISHLADSISYVKLETNDDCIIGEINGVYNYKHKYYVLDRKTSTIFVFNKNGGYEYKIRHVGRGPGEYTSISRFLIDEQKEQIIVYDVRTRKIIWYNLHGDVVSEKKIELSTGGIIRDLVNLPNGDFLCAIYKYDNNDNSYWGLILCDSTMTTSKVLYLPNEFYPNSFPEHFTQCFSLPDGAGAWLPTATDIYCYTNDSLKKYINYNVLERNMPQMFPGVKYTGNQKIVNIFFVEDKTSCIITSFLGVINLPEKYGRNVTLPCISLWDKKNKIAKTGMRINFNGELIEGTTVYFNVYNKLLRLYSGEKLEDLVENPENKGKVKNLFTANENIGESNPVLQIIHLK